MKLYQIVEDEDNELVEPTAIINDDVLDTYLGMVALLKNNRKHKFNDTKDEALYVDCRFILRISSLCRKIIQSLQLYFSRDT